MTEHKTMLSKSLLFTLAVASGLAVANIYYNQPLLADISSSFEVPTDRAGYVATFTQVGYALGLLLFVPLGDIRERRKLVSQLLLCVSVSLLGAAVSPTIEWLYIASFVVGLTTVVPQILIPFSAQLAEPEQRGRVIGTVTSGLLFGILLARTVSGLIGGSWGWRWMFGLAAVMMLILYIVLRIQLPVRNPDLSSNYFDLLRSLFTLLRKHIVLREAALIGALNFAAFSCFWTSLVFFLGGSPYNYPSQVAGLFGLFGVAGALVVPWIGRITDRLQPEIVIGAMIIVLAVSFALFFLYGTIFIVLVLGIILMDIGVQGAQISNQARIYALDEGARSRLNTVLMVSTFIGGAFGSSLGSYMWSVGQWSAASLTGLCLTLLSFVVWGIVRLRTR
ncbi:MFS transporter [Paenibacillus kribbensis]|uniref:MFS transporter n=1 Tax=Paenibacillus kribbensis TaxID=172713 RepID=UPI002DBCCF7B|nr:MFS transporter [Paenibacillus kribbensis]MEC0236241.1 MFS transporter [Paenibacillus kribbensis]